MHRPLYEIAFGGVLQWRPGKLQGTSGEMLPGRLGDSPMAWPVVRGLPCWLFQRHNQECEPRSNPLLTNCLLLSLMVAFQSQHPPSPPPTPARGQLVPLNYAAKTPISALAASRIATSPCITSLRMHLLELTYF